MSDTVTSNLPFVLGACFWLYWPASWLLVDAARKEYRNEPYGLLTTACFYSFLTVGFLGPLLIAVLSNPYATIFAYFIALPGWLGWCIVAVARRKWAGPVVAQGKVPRLQCYMKDLILSAFLFGTSMLLVSLLIADRFFGSFEEAVAFSASYFLFAVVLALLAALDLFRYLPQPFSARRRAAVLSVLFFYAALSLLLGFLFAWITWKRAVNEAAQVPD